MSWTVLTCGLAVLVPLCLQTAVAATKDDVTAPGAVSPWMPGPHTCRKSPPNEPRQLLASSSGPITVGGVRYDLSERQMTAICQEKPIRLPDGSYLIAREFKGYRISIPVDGDFGQLLNVSVTGRSSQALQLTVSCGSFSGNDSGTRFIIQREQRNAVSCQRMDIVLQSESTNEAEVNLSIMLTERI